MRKQAKLRPRTNVDGATGGNATRIDDVRAKKRARRLRAVLTDINERYKRVFKRLAR